MLLPPIWPSLQLLGDFVFPVQRSADTQGHQRCHCLVFAAGATSLSHLWSRVLLDQAWPVHRESSSQIQINSLDVVQRTELHLSSPKGCS